LTQARIIQAIKGRGNHSDDDLVVREQILNFTALVENRENCCGTTLAGTVAIDPRKDDFFVGVVEER
jgi:hypothetical protein